MGYFANGSEAERYESEYCANCMNYREVEFGYTCPILELHFEYNYQECNNNDSFLHVLIPRGEDGLNEQCQMYLPKEEPNHDES